jgi:ParB/RepB/Spo0J family partition protein
MSKTKTVPITTDYNGTFTVLSAKDYIATVNADRSKNISRSGMDEKFWAKSVEALAQQIINDGNVIKQPLIVMPNPEGDVKDLVAGFRRDGAIRLLAEADIEVNVPIIIRTGLDDVARIDENLIENFQRENPNHVQIAEVIAVLSAEPYNLKDDDIASKLGYRNATNVRLHRKVLALDAKIKRDLAAGKYTLEGALEFLAAAPGEERDAAVAEAEKHATVEHKTGKKKVKAKAVRKAVEAATGKSSNKRRGVKEILGVFQQLVDSAEAVGPNLAALGEVTVKYVEGKMAERTYLTKLYAIFEPIDKAAAKAAKAKEKAA